jgi:5'-nucleotidase
MNKRPLILVTNDDGIHAPGMKALVEVALQFGEVLVVAPDTGQSGMGHAITISNILRLREIEYLTGVKAYSCTGTPVDCVKLAIYKVLQKKPDLLLSGINHGPNNSINVIYSGTMSAAVEGALEGIPSIGFSLLDYSHHANMEAAKYFAGKIVRNTLQNGIPNDVCLNVNIPKVIIEDIKGIKICRQAKGNWEDNFEVRTDPHQRNYYWLTGEFKSQDKGEDTDVFALNNNFVSVVPVQYDLTAYHAIAAINEWNYE